MCILHSNTQHLSNSLDLSICRVAYSELSRFRIIRHYLSVDATQTPICAFALSRIGYCNSLLAGIPKELLDLEKYLSVDATKIAICAFVLSRINHCTSVLAGIPKYPLHNPPKQELRMHCLQISKASPCSPSFPPTALASYPPKNRS